MKKTKIILVLSILFIGLLSAGLYSFLKKDVPEDISSKYESVFKKSYKKSTVPIKFYGQVLDQDSKPIKDVKVTIKVTYYDPKEEFWESQRTKNLVTDADGKFKLKDKGRLIFVGVTKDGYEHLPDDNEYAHGIIPNKSYNYDPSRNAHQPDKNNPEIFYLRKKAYPAYLAGSGPSGDEVLWGKFDITRGFETKLYIAEGYYDAYGKDGFMPDGNTSLEQDASRSGDKDIQISGTIPSANMYEIEFTALVVNSGLILSDEHLDEAPASGYLSSVTILVPTDSTADFKKYIYAKTADSSFYSRFDIEIMIRERGKGRLIITSWTNPDGSRNLKYDREYQRHEESWREKLSHLRYAATQKYGIYRTRYLSKYDLGEAIGIKPDGTFDETLFQQEANALKEQLKTEDPRWWHELE